MGLSQNEKSIMNYKRMSAFAMTYRLIIPDERSLAVLCASRNICEARSKRNIKVQEKMNRMANRKEATPLTAHNPL